MVSDCPEGIIMNQKLLKNVFCIFNTNALTTFGRFCFIIKIGENWYGSFCKSLMTADTRGGESEILAPT